MGDPHVFTEGGQMLTTPSFDTLQVAHEIEISPAHTHVAIEGQLLGR